MTQQAVSTILSSDLVSIMTKIFDLKDDILSPCWPCDELVTYPG